MREFLSPRASAFLETFLSRGILNGPTCDGATEKKQYDRGVGTNWYTGWQAAAEDQDGYPWLVGNYLQPRSRDYEVSFAVGFSRGANTARYLLGMTRKVEDTQMPLGELAEKWRHIVAGVCLGSSVLLLVILALLYRYDEAVTRTYDLAVAAGALGGCVDFSWRTLGRDKAIQSLSWAEFWNGYARIISGAIVGVVLWGLTFDSSSFKEHEPLLIGVAALCGVFTPVVFNQLFAQIGGSKGNS